MVSETAKNDKIFAREICDKIRAGNRGAINEVCEEYQKHLGPFARQSLSDPDQAEAFLTEFWNELSDGKMICEYSESDKYYCFIK